MKISIVVSEYYKKISHNLLQGALLVLKRNNVKILKIYKINGTLEIPTVVSKIIKKNDGVIVLGCVIKGQTKHFELICMSVTQSLLNLSTQNKKPIGNGILSCNNMKQARLRADIKKRNKGGEAAKAVISVFKSLKNG